MADRARLGAVLLITFVSVTLAARLLASAPVALDFGTITVALAVTAIELIALEALRWRRRSYFVVWLALAMVQAFVSVGVSLWMFRAIDLTSTAVFLLLTVPAVQAGALMADAGAHRAWRPRQ